MNSMKQMLIDKEVLVEYPDCYLIRQAMPYPLATSNSYLVEVDQGWAIIDVGVDLPMTRELWLAVLPALGITWAQIKGIYITHCHPDHLGAAAWIQRMSEAPVFMLDFDIERVLCYIFLWDNYADKDLQNTEIEMAKQGFTETKRLRLAADWEAQVRPLYPPPEWIEPFCEGQIMRFRGKPFQVKTLPGHTDGQVGFWCRDNGCMFSADLVAAKGGYLHFTDWPNTREDNPLGALFQAVEEITVMGITELWPGHGPRITEPLRTLEQLVARHHAQFARVSGFLQHKAYSAAELYLEMMQLTDEEYIHFHRVSLGEALGYLRYLEASGQARSCVEHGVIRFGKA